MSGFALPNNYTDNPEALLRKSRSRTTSSSATPSVVEPVTPVPSATDEDIASDTSPITNSTPNSLEGPKTRACARHLNRCIRSLCYILIFMRMGCY
jgi:hypothetical protein